MVSYNVSLEGKTVLVTGAAGFIGSNLVKRLFNDVPGIRIIGIDSLNNYYDVNIKFERLQQLNDLAAKLHPGKDEREKYWKFVKGNIADMQTLNHLFAEEKPSVVVNLAAQAGVRYSITNPDAYIESNLIGF